MSYSTAVLDITKNEVFGTLSKQETKGRRTQLKRKTGRFLGSNGTTKIACRAPTKRNTTHQGENKTEKGKQALQASEPKCKSLLIIHNHYRLSNFWEIAREYGNIEGHDLITGRV